MSARPQMFSESWYRIAGQAVMLRPSVQVHKQHYRRERWYVLRDAFTNSFYRLRPAAYEFVARLDSGRPVEEVWKECLNEDPDGAPGQEEVIQLLAQLYHANLIRSTLAPDSAQLFERYKKERQKETRSKIANFLFLKIPLLDPNRLLTALLPLARLLMNRWGFLLWLVVVGWAGKVAIENFDELLRASAHTLQPGNLLWLGACSIVLKVLHEFGHGIACRRYGGEVHTAGITLMIFTPVPFVDATSSWSFRSRWQRMTVAAAGMFVEFFCAALACFVWASAGEGLVKDLAYNVLIVASVTTLLFNINPLLRFDGYYIHSDLLDIPNLQQNSDKQLLHLIERYLFSLVDSTSPANSPSEAFWLSVYGVASRIYRVVLVTTIIFMVSGQFLGIGILLGVFLAVLWLVIPTVKGAHYVISNARLQRKRARAVSVSATVLAGIVAFLALVPFPHSFQAPGVLQATGYSEALNESAGYVSQVLVASGTAVTKGQPLIEMTDPEIDLRIEAGRAVLEDLQSRLRVALQKNVTALRGLNSQLEVQKRSVAELLESREKLILRARQSGLWVCPRAEELRGVWAERGTQLGEIVEPTAYHFLAVVSQETAGNLFNHAIQKAEVRLRGQAAQALQVTGQRLVQAQQEELPSPALSTRAGGEIELSPKDPEGKKVLEPFFIILADLTNEAHIALLHDRTGRIRFSLPPEPLLTQWFRKFRQLLQRKYQI